MESHNSDATALNERKLSEATPEQQQTTTKRSDLMSANKKVINRRITSKFKNPFPVTKEGGCDYKEQTEGSKNSKITPVNGNNQQQLTTSDGEYISLQEALAISKANLLKNQSRAPLVQTNLLTLIINILKQHKIPAATQRANLKESGWELHPTDINKVRTCPCQLNFGTPYLKGNVPAHKVRQAIVTNRYTNT